MIGNKLDLRQVGTIIGLPVYVDFASIPNVKYGDEVFTERDRKELLVQKILSDMIKVRTPDNSGSPMKGKE